MPSHSASEIVIMYNRGEALATQESEGRVIVDNHLYMKRDPVIVLFYFYFIILLNVVKNMLTSHIDGHYQG
jgi:hypothetical protein